MKLKVNGAEHEHQGGGTVADVLKELGANRDRVAVMVNDRIVSKADFCRIQLNPGDDVDVLTFMGGG